MPLSQHDIAMYDQSHADAILKPEILIVLFEFFNKPATFNFLSVSKQSRILSKQIFDKYAFVHSIVKTQPIEYKSNIKHLIFDEEKCDSLDLYSKLETVLVRHEKFNGSLDFIPSAIKEIRIKGNLFNLPIGDTFSNLKTLIIDSMSFNCDIDPGIISRLDKCTITSPTYGKRIDSNNAVVNSLMFGTKKFDTKEEIPILKLTPNNDLIHLVC
jgi:hypothetical protein